jgi:hypothetical protein
MLHVRTGYRIIPIASIAPLLHIAKWGDMWGLDIDGVEVLYGSQSRAEEVRKQLRTAISEAISNGDCDGCTCSARRSVAFGNERPARLASTEPCYKMTMERLGVDDQSPYGQTDFYSTEDAVRNRLDEICIAENLTVLDIREGCLEP